MKQKVCEIQRQRFYAIRYNFFPENPIGQAQFFKMERPLKFRNLEDAIKFAFNDYDKRSKFVDEDGNVRANKHYGGCCIVYGYNALTGIDYMQIFYDGVIEEYSDTVARVRSKLGR